MNTIVKQYDVDFDKLNYFFFIYNSNNREVESGFFYFIKCNIVSFVRFK